MIKLKLLDYRITNDERNLIVSKVRYSEDGQISRDKKGKEYTKTLAYLGLGNIKGVLSVIENDYVFNDEEVITDFKQLSARYTAITEHLKQLNEELEKNIKQNEYI